MAFVERAVALAPAPAARQRAVRRGQRDDGLESAALPIQAGETGGIGSRVASRQRRKLALLQEQQRATRDLGEPIRSFQLREGGKTLRERPLGGFVEYVEQRGFLGV